MAGDHLKTPGGKWKYTNKLAKSLSPYLLQHAHNPVNWYPWNDEALALARKEHKLIFLSVGYSTCYWCHVMEREVFENEDVAELLNKHFICIKVDREERPDLDDIYMVARQVMSGQGGWPNNLFLTPDLKPFFAGGTFSLDTRYGEVNFPAIVQAVLDAWQQKHDDIVLAADEISERMKQGLFNQKEEVPGSITYESLVQNVVIQLKGMHDHKYGGFHGAPKFPHENYLLFLLDYYEQTKHFDVREILERSLNEMSAGGITDHVGGGLHRYSVDEKWLVPHFEKMLYNQALMIKTYARAYEVLEDEFYRYMLERYCDFVSQSMTGEQGMFYSALDAEVDGVEGAYYVWEKQEIEQALTAKQAKVFFEHFALACVPHVEGHAAPKGKVLHRKRMLLLHDEEQEILQSALNKLAAIRQKRQAPLLDDKVVLSWNGLMVEAYAEAYKVTRQKKYLTAATKAARWMLRYMVSEEGMLIRIYRKGKAQGLSFLEDYAHFIRGLIALYEVDEKQKWLEEARLLMEKAMHLFWDKRLGGFVSNRAVRESWMRIKLASDMAIPSDNGVMLHNLLLLQQYGVEGQWLPLIQQQIDVFYSDVAYQPVNYITMVHGFHMLRTIGLDRVLADAHVASNDNRFLSSSLVFARLYVPETQPKKGEPFLVTVELDVAEHWHVYASNAAKDLGTPLKLSFQNEHGLKVLDLSYPESNDQLNYDNQQVPLCHGKLVITATLKWENKPSKLEDLRALLSFQTCQEGRCLAPATMVLEPV